MTWERLQKLRANIERAAALLNDTDALDSAEMFAEWMPDTEYAVGDRRRHGDLLYKCRQAHTSQAGWEPNAVPALWSVISIEDGNREHPKAYSSGMELEEGLYYTDDGALYICTRSTGIPVYNPLAALAGIYIEEVTEDV